MKTSLTGLGILRNSSGPEIERKRKQIIQIFKSCGLNITVKTNLKTVDFLDVRLDLTNNTYQPYRKSNSETVHHQALGKSGFTEELKYNNKDRKGQTRNKEKRKRRMKMIWINPPFSLSVKTNIGKLFFKMIKKNFPKSDRKDRVIHKEITMESYLFYK